MYSLTRKKKIISLFSGAGGLEIGAAYTKKISQIYSTDRNEKFFLTLTNNMSTHFPNIKHNGMIADSKDLKGIDILKECKFAPDIVMGGPPCDDFTTTGRRMGDKGEKGILIFDFLRLVKEINAPCFIFENVPNLDVQFKSYFKKFLDKASRYKYKIKKAKLFANDFGSPTKRSRIFVIGFKKESNFNNFKFPSPSHILKDDLGLFNKTSDKKNFVYVSDVLESLPDTNTSKDEKYLNHEARKHKIETIEHLKTIPPGKSVKKSYRYRAPWNGLCRSLTAGTDDSTKAYIHPKYHREMTVREYARIQGFPDTWFFHGTLHNGIKQVANAVPIPLAEAVLKSVLYVL